MSRELTKILRDIKEGDLGQHELFELVYDELKLMAEGQMRSERSEHTLQSTALVHEAWLRLSNGEQVTWQNRRHFFAAAAESMRRILIESARSRNRKKRGGNAARLELGEQHLGNMAAIDLDQLMDIEQRLAELGSESPELAELINLRFFAGLSMQDIANCLELSLSTVERKWRFARAWLADRLDGPHD